MGNTRAARLPDVLSYKYFYDIIMYKASHYFSDYIKFQRILRQGIGTCYWTDGSLMFSAFDLGTQGCNARSSCLS